MTEPSPGTRSDYASGPATRQGFPNGAPRAGRPFTLGNDRLLPTPEARDLLALVRDVADKELAPRVEEHERAETYPEGLFATLGAAGLLGLPYRQEWGGGGSL